MKSLKEAHMPLSFCLEFIIIAVWKRLVGGVKVFLLRISSNYMLLGKGDASKRDVDLTSDAICIITHAQGPCICRKRGDIILFPQGEPKVGIETPRR